MAIMGTIVAGATDLGGAAGAQDFADAMETAFYVGAGMLALGFIARALPDAGRQAGGHRVARARGRAGRRA